MKSLKEKYQGKDYATIAEKIAKKYPKRDWDNIQKKSYEREIKDLISYQEAQKVLEAKQQSQVAPQEFKTGGGLFDNLFRGVGKSVVDGAMNNGNVGKAIMNGAMNNGLAPAPAKEGFNFGKFLKDDVNAPAIIGQGLNLATNLAQLAGGYDRETVNNNPYEEDVRRLSSNSIDSTAQRELILGMRNAAINGNQARSVNTKRSLDANTDVATTRQLSQSLLNQDQVNSQLKLQQAGILNNLGQQNVQAETYTDDINARNKAAYQTGVSDLSAQVGDIGMTVTKARANRVANNLMAQAVSGKYSSFGITPDLINKLTKGTLTDDEELIVMKIPEVTKDFIQSFK